MVNIRDLSGGLSCGGHHFDRFLCSHEATCSQRWWSVNSWNRLSKHVKTTHVVSETSYQITSYLHRVIDAMPTGFVCQLHYHGGGSLLCQTSTGDSRQLPFAHAPPHVRIGHTVSFSLAADGAVSAVDLEVIKEKAATFAANSEGLQGIHQKAAKPLLSLAKQPTRKLQRSIARFHNADLEERLQMIEAAEGLLHDLLAAVELDGDAICKLLCRCAGWLHAPGSCGAKHVAAIEVAALSQPSEPRDLQRRVRRLLISTLGALDLSDTTTFQVVETAVLYILQLMQGKETVSGNAKSLATRQWRQLGELLVADVQPVPTKRKASDGAPEVFKDQAARTTDRSVVVDGVYRPNERIRGLATVFEAPDRVVLLKCAKCVERISTSWFWKHPRHGGLHALVPLHGHLACGKMGKKSPWLSLDDTKIRLDFFEHLDFCHHNRQRSRCRECEGRALCPHNRQRSYCKECGGRGICPHNRRRTLCRECGGGGICSHNRQRWRCPECKTRARK